MDLRSSVVPVFLIVQLFATTCKFALCLMHGGFFLSFH